MANAFTNTGLFLINILIDLYLLAIMLRFLLQWVKADFYNPVCQFLIKVTDPVLVPLRRFIPGFFGVDMASVFLMFIIQFIQLYLVALISHAYIGWFIIPATIKDLFLLLIRVYIYAIIIQAILSWFAKPGTYNPMSILLFQLTEPILKPFRQLIKPAGGIDFSPIVALICLFAVSIFISSLPV